MDRNTELPAALRAAAQSGYGADALAWRELLESAAAEIDRLRVRVAENEGVRSGR